MRLIHMFYFQASGVGVNPECMKAFTDIKLGHKYRYIVYSISKDLREISVLNTAPPCKYGPFLCEIYSNTITLYSYTIRL